MSRATVKPYDLFSKGNAKERTRCLAALEVLAPGVPEGFVRGTVMGILGEYPDTWREFAEFDTRWKLNWARLHVHQQKTKEWLYRLEDDAVWFKRERKEPLVDWQRE
jgi:hypothetical protein